MAQATELLPYLGALAAALAGSLHCAGMCGPLRLLCSEGEGARSKYQAGRGLAYALLGALAGGIGFVLPFWLLVGLICVAFAMSLLHVPALPGWNRLRQSILRVGSASPFLLGLSSGLLPCGLLHGWLAAAAATGKPLQGGILLFLLWAGSLPALELAPYVLKKPFGSLHRRFPLGMKVSLLAIALLPLLYRLPSEVKPTGSPPENHCHHSASLPPMKTK